MQEIQLFEFLKSKPVSPQIGIRETLFGDMPLAQLVAASSKALSVEPWVSFERGNELIDSGDTQNAIEIFRRIVQTPDFESRHYLQAWYFLRGLGVNAPKEREKDLLGIVVEVGMPKGLDMVAAYPDYHARYYNFSGAGIIWDRPNSTVDAAIDDLLRIGRTVVQSIGLWKESRPPAPASGNARINLLTPSGLHFGEGPLDVLSKDRLGGAVIASAFRLMQELIKVTRK